MWLQVIWTTNFQLSRHTYFHVRGLHSRLSFDIRLNIGNTLDCTALWWHNGKLQCLFFLFLLPPRYLFNKCYPFFFFLLIILPATFFLCLIFFLCVIFLPILILSLYFGALLIFRHLKDPTGGNSGLPTMNADTLTPNSRGGGCGAEVSE